jgi:hypothetical protein
LLVARCFEGSSWITRRRLVRAPGKAGTPTGFHNLLSMRKKTSDLTCWLFPAQKPFRRTATPRSLTSSAHTDQPLGHIRTWRSTTSRNPLHPISSLELSQSGAWSIITEIRASFRGPITPDTSWGARRRGSLSLPLSLSLDVSDPDAQSMLTEARTRLSWACCPKYTWMYMRWNILRDQTGQGEGGIWPLVSTICSTRHRTTANFLSTIGMTGGRDRQADTWPNEQTYTRHTKEKVCMSSLLVLF